MYSPRNGKYIHVLKDYGNFCIMSVSKDWFSMTDYFQNDCILVITNEAQQ